MAVSSDNVHRNQACGHLQNGGGFLLGLVMLRLDPLLGASRYAQEEKECRDRKETNGYSHG